MTPLEILFSSISIVEAIALFFMGRSLGKIDKRHAVFVKCLSQHSQGILKTSDLSLECGYAAIADGHNGRLPVRVQDVEEFRQEFREFQCDQAAESVARK